MQKKMFVFFALLLFLPAIAMARDFNGFSADVPPGWEVIEEKDAMVGFVSPGREAVVTVTVASSRDVDPAAFAAEMAQGWAAVSLWRKMASTVSRSGKMAWPSYMLPTRICV